MLAHGMRFACGKEAFGSLRLVNALTPPAVKNSPPEVLQAVSMARRSDGLSLHDVETLKLEQWGFSRGQALRSRRFPEWGLGRAVGQREGKLWVRWEGDAGATTRSDNWRRALLCADSAAPAEPPPPPPPAEAIQALVFEASASLPLGLASDLGLCESFTFAAWVRRIGV